MAGSWLLGTAAGIPSAALQTDSGRAVVSSAILDLANNSLNGSVTVSAIEGTFLGGLIARDVKITGQDGVRFAEIAALQLSYGLRDLLGGRLVLGRLTLTSLEINLMQPRGRPMNVVEIFGSRASDREEPTGASDSRGPRLVVAFRDVDITDAEITIRTPLDSNEVLGRDVEQVAGGPMWVRRFSKLDAVMPYVRIASPDPAHQGVRFDVASISALISHPALELTGARGTVEVRNDSVLLDFTDLRLPDCRAEVYGLIDLAGDREQYDLEVRAHGVATDQIRSLVNELPAGMSGSGTFVVRSLPNAVEFAGSGVTFNGLSGGGTATGDISMVVGPESHWAFRNTRLDLDDLDLEYVRAFFDTLPVAGRVTGRFEADGPREQMTLGLDIVLRDSLVAGWPISVFDGAGTVSLGVPGDLVFHDYIISHADFDLGTVQRILAGVELNGRLSGSGTINGPWLELAFNGDMWHFDDPEFVTEASGDVRIDARGDTLGVWSDLMFEALALDGIRPSYPSIRIGGTFEGRVVTAGYLDSLWVDAAVAGQGGALFVEGHVSPLSVRRAAYGMDVRVSRLNLAELYPGLPRTVLFGRMQGTWVDDSLQGQSADMHAILRASTLEGVSLDSVSWNLAVANGLLVLDSVRGSGRGLEAYAAGALGIGAENDGSIAAFVATDSMGLLEPFLSGLFGPLPDELSVTARRPSGSLRADVQVVGSLSDYHASAEFQGRRIDRGSVFVDSLGGRVEWNSGARRALFEMSLDSLELGAWVFADIEVALDGPIDSLEWFARSRFGADGWGGAIARGMLISTSGKRTMPVDLMAFQLATGQWSVDLPAVVEFSDSGIDFVRNTITRRDAAGKVTIEGRLPFAGTGMLAASVEGLPAEDLWMLIQRPYRNVRGEVSGNFTLAGTAADPTMVLFVGLRQGVFGEFRAPQMLGEWRYENRRVQGDVRLLRTGEEILNVNVQLPVDLALTEVERRRLPGEISIRAVADGVDLSFMDAINPVVRRTAGMLYADVGITGTWENPELDGNLSIEDGTVTYPVLGVRHNDLNGSVVMSGDTIRIERFVVASGNGSAELSGFLRLEELTKPVLNIRINAKEFHGATVRDFVSVTATGSAELTGPFFGGTLSGEGTVTRGVLYFADLVEKEIINIEDTLLAREGLVDPALIRRQGLGVAFENRFLDSLRIDNLRLEMGPDVWLRSTEANIQLLGSVTINKELNEYRFNGTLRTPRGTYTLSPGPSLVQLVASRNFDVTRGEVTYFGTPDLNAALDIDARHRVRTVRGDDITVFVHIAGTLYEPSLTFTSDIRPPISADEILSYLFFSAPSFHALAGGSGAENGRLVRQGLTQFLGAVSGQLENLAISDLSLPLEYLQIRPQWGTSVIAGEVAVGKRLGDRWFLTVSPQICYNEGQGGLDANVGAGLEYRLSRDWLFSLSGDPVQSCAIARSHATTLKYQLGADIFWEKRY